MKTVTLPTGDRVPAFGLGSWNMGDDPARRAEEISVLRRGIELGVALIDTAEMYGDGRAEELVAEAIAGRRDDVFLVSKVLPQNASRRGVPTACERSLRRLNTDRLDLYLLHWRGDVPLEETLEAFQALKQSGKIRHYGVSNFDLADMEELGRLPGGRGVVTNQVLYNLVRRGIEWDLLPWLRKHHLPLMAYSPLEQGKLARNRKLQGFAAKYGMNASQAGLAWLLAKDDVIVIPKTSRSSRLEENLAAVGCTLTQAQLAELDKLFPPPRGPEPLAIL